jgi:hypothetical protein
MKVFLDDLVCQLVIRIEIIVLLHIIPQSERSICLLVGVQLQHEFPLCGLIATQDDVIEREVIVLPAIAIRHDGLPGELLILHLTINGDELVLVYLGGSTHHVSDFPRILPNSCPWELRCALIIKGDGRLMAVQGELVGLSTASYTLWLVKVARLLLLFMLGKRLELFL